MTISRSSINQALNKAIKAVLLTLGVIGACQANAAVTYTYTDSTDPRFTGNVAYSGSFSVASALADGAYSFASAAAQPAGFTEDFFTASFVDGAGVTRTPNLSVFDITITNGQVSAWDIEATTPFTRVSYSGGKKLVPSYHASVVIFHDTTTSDFQTYYDVAIPYQISPTGLPAGPGVWSGGGIPAVAAVPEPETYALLIAGLGLMGFVARRRKRKAS
jgi:hypothetical protein